MVNKRTVSKIMESMREKGEVFYNSPIKPSTHHLRKAFVSYMRPRMHTFSVAGEKLRKEDVQMITHWNEGRDDTAASVYDKNDYLDVKAAILKAWVTYVMEGYSLYMQSITPFLQAAE
ncbi:MAG: integrase family protein [Rhizobium sp.]|nr:integrase family protein [Rhizobium sp.]